MILNKSKKKDPKDGSIDGVIDTFKLDGKRVLVVSGYEEIKVVCNNNYPFDLRYLSSIDDALKTLGNYKPDLVIIDAGESEEKIKNLVNVIRDNYPNTLLAGIMESASFEEIKNPEKSTHYIKLEELGIEPKFRRRLASVDFEQGVCGLLYKLGFEEQLEMKIKYMGKLKSPKKLRQWVKEAFKDLKKTALYL